MPGCDHISLFPPLSHTETPQWSKKAQPVDWGFKQRASCVMEGWRTGEPYIVYAFPLLAV